MRRAPGSFRDPSGYVWEEETTVLRSVNAVYAAHWAKAGPFLHSLAKDGLVLPFQEVTPLPGSWKTLETRRLPFISFPYEWSVSQLKDAALLTLRIQRRALAAGLTLKDASAYNIQFIGNRPVFLDLLSFEILEEGKPWVAYAQFCSHFLAPLALACLTDLRCGAFSRLWIDGIPLDMAAKLLPWRARARFGLLFHLFLHARMQGKYADSGAHARKAKKLNVTASSLERLAVSLRETVKALKPRKTRTEWGDYYDATNYSDAAAQSKYAAVERMLSHAPGGALAVDLGANTGRYTRLLATRYAEVLAADIDPLAVDRHYQDLKREGPGPILPLVLDLANPSPSLGFHCAERRSFPERCTADCVMALALIHHLRISFNIPLALQADFFADLLKDKGILILEFVPKGDSQVDRLLTLRQDIFEDYDLERCTQIFSTRFDLLESVPVEDSGRVLLLWQKK